MIDNPNSATADVDVVIDDTGVYVIINLPGLVVRTRNYSVCGEYPWLRYSVDSTGQRFIEDLTVGLGQK